MKKVTKKNIRQGQTVYYAGYDWSVRPIKAKVMSVFILPHDKIKPNAGQDLFYVGCPVNWMRDIVLDVNGAKTNFFYSRRRAQRSADLHN